MKNYFKVLPVLFWTIIQGTVINTDNVSSIAYIQDGGITVFFVGGESNSLYFQGYKTPTQLWNDMVNFKF